MRRSLAASPPPLSRCGVHGLPSSSWSGGTCTDDVTNGLSRPARPPTCPGFRELAAPLRQAWRSVAVDRISSVQLRPRPGAPTSDPAEASQCSHRDLASQLQARISRELAAGQPLLPWQETRASTSASTTLSPVGTLGDRRALPTDDSWAETIGDMVSGEAPVEPQRSSFPFRSSEGTDLSHDLVQTGPATSFPLVSECSSELALAAWFSPFDLVPFGYLAEWFQTGPLTILPIQCGLALEDLTSPPCQYLSSDCSTVAGWLLDRGERLARAATSSCHGY